MVANTVNTELYVAVGLVVGFFFGFWQRRVVDEHNFQNDGEALVASALQRHFNTQDYHLLNHIIKAQGCYNAD
jgi:hypothetical protein